MHGKELIPELAMVVHSLIIKWLQVLAKEIVGVLGRLKVVFRYRFSRFDLEDRWFNFIPRGET